MWHGKMIVYGLLRTKEIDKTGRPALFLNYFGDHSLVWYGTTVKNDKLPDEPLTLIIGDKPVYFYTQNIYQLLTSDLKWIWKDRSNGKPYVLSDDDQKKLIGKIARDMTHQKDPYQQLNKLDLENQILVKENEELKRKNKLLKEKKVLVREQDLENEYE